MILRNFKMMLFLLIAAAGMAGCVREYGVGEMPIPTHTDEGEVTITVNIPGQQTPSTRSIADAGGEAVVKTIDIFVFEPGEGSNPETLVQHVAGEVVSQSDVKDEKYKVTFKAALTPNTDASTLVILANVPAATITSAKAFTQKQEILAALTHASTGKWNANPDNEADPVAGTDYALIPMYGEAILTGGITAAMTINDINLTRMLARVDVVNNATSDFTLTDVYVVNYNTKGYIAQAWNPSTGMLLNPQYASAPMIPTGANPLGVGVVSTEANALRYEGTEMRGDIYIYEAASNPNDPMEENIDHTKSICLIVKGKLTGDATPYYYRIDFTGDNEGLAPDKVEYVPVYRNHLYTFDITAVNGVGYGSFDSALRSFGVLNNLKTKLHVVDESGIKNMVFNGEHYLGVTQAEFSLMDREYTGLDLTMLTNAKDLKATTSDGWITPGAVQYLSDNKYTLCFDVSEMNGLDIANRTGYIILTAGRLRKEIAVIQMLWGGEGHILYLASDGTLQVDTWDSGIVNDANAMQFKFGGVIGSTMAEPEGTTWVASNPTFYNPSTTIITTPKPNYATIPNIDNAGLTFTNGEEYNISDNAYHNLTNVKKGLGDPCRLVGMTVAQIQSMNTDAQLYALEETLKASGIGGWRLPTAAENVYFVGGPSDGNWYKWIITSPSSYTNYTNLSSSYPDCFTVNGETSSNPGVAKFPLVSGFFVKGSSTLPAMGYRWGGASTSPGKYGFYWASTALALGDPPFNSLACFNLRITESAVNGAFNSTTGYFGNIRCVRQ